jgi:23S rRNA (pseudouridine1915-N3)-methyltransferase
MEATTMKFSDVNEKTWDGLRPFVDTCILPVTGLTGKELPWEATCALEDLRDALDLFEIPYKGRVLTYPALHYVTAASGTDAINLLCTLLKDNGFAFVILVSAKVELDELLASSNADLAFILTPQLLTESLPEHKKQIANQLMQLWTNSNS